MDLLPPILLVEAEAERLTRYLATLKPTAWSPPQRVYFMGGGRRGGPPDTGNGGVYHLDYVGTLWGGCSTSISR